MTATFTATDVRHSLPLAQSDRANAANFALQTAEEIANLATEAWSIVKDLASMAPLAEVEPKDAALRRNAVRLNQATSKALGIVSASAAGLVFVTHDAKIGVCEDTTHGSDYLDGVRFLAHAQGDEPTWSRYGEEYPVQGIVAFFDSYAEARDFLAR